METIVRLREIELQGFKNVEYGLVQMPSALEHFPSSSSADILGIYGQNGSGKTAVIEAMSFVQKLLSGGTLPENAMNYICAGMECCTIRVRFCIAFTFEQFLADYQVTIGKHNGRPEIKREKLSYAARGEETASSWRTLFDYDTDLPDIVFRPKFRYAAMIKQNEENRINLAVAKKITQREKCSFLFGSEGRRILIHGCDDAISRDYEWLIKALYCYANLNLFVISSQHSGPISLNFLIPVAFRRQEGEHIQKGDLPIRLDGVSIISKQHYSLAVKLIAEMNIVLCEIVPGMRIKIHNFGEQLMEDGSEGYRIELLSQRGDGEIPLNFESEGIIKIISILNVLMCIYNNDGMCLVIDELDSGIFEFLLGELLSVFERGAKGQLLFTSHNLRALEVIDKKCLLFSTTNPKNRYMRMQNIKTNNNLRSTYFRTILLGGQKEEIYAETDSIEIGRAFRKAGKDQG